MKTLPLILTLAMTASVLTSASAQDIGSTEAVELFRQGRALLENKDYAGAYPKFVASLRLKRAVGTYINMAECEQATGRLALAREHWQEAAALADATQDPLNRGEYARKRFAELDKRVPRLAVKPATGAPPDTTVRRDGLDLTPAMLDVAFPVDPGTHSVVASASGRQPKTYEVNLAEGASRVLEVEPGVSVASTEPPLPTALPTAPAVAETGRPPISDTGTSIRILGYATVGLGVVGLGLGAAFGVRAASSWSEAKDDCRTSCGPGSPAQTKRDDASSAGTLSTVFFLSGGAALATGIFLIVVAPPRRMAGQVRLMPGPGSLVAYGRF